MASYNRWFPSFLIVLGLCFLTPDGAHSKALRFDGVNDYVEIAPHPSLDIRNQITFESWIKWEEELGISQFQILLNRDYIAYEFAIGEGHGNGKFVWALGNVGTSAPDAYGGWRIVGPIQRNTWVHVAFTYDGRRAKGYVNGELVADHSANGGIRSQPANAVRIGMRDLSSHPSYFHGAIDEMRLWSVARTKEQIKENMYKPLEGSEKGLAAYWDFDEGSGQKAHDKTSNGNHGVLGSGGNADVSDPVWLQEGAPLQPTPSTPIVNLLPEDPGTLDDLVVEVSGFQPTTGPSPNLVYRWYRNDNLIPEESGEVLSSTQTQKGQIIRCDVSLSYGGVEGEPGSDSVRIRNTQPFPPVFRLIPENPMPNDPLAVVFDEPGWDPDGDSVFYVFEWFESSDGVTWNRRPEVSGLLPPPIYVVGQPEISGLYTQIGDYWRVEVSVWDGDLEGLSTGKGLIASNPGSPPKLQGLLNQVRVQPNLSGASFIGPNDLLFLLSHWKTPKGEMDPEVALKFFEQSAPDSERVSKDQLYLIGLDYWFMPTE